MEIDDQSLAIKWIKEQGGYARKWSSHFQKGMPDIIGSFRSTGGFLLEAKRLKDLVTGFERKLEVTPKQHFELTEYQKAGMLTGILVFVRMRARPEIHIVVMPTGTESLSWDQTLEHGMTYTPRTQSKPKMEAMLLNLKERMIK